MPQEQAWNLALVNRREWVPCTADECEYWLGTVPPARIEKNAFLVGEPRANTLSGKAVYLMAVRDDENHFVTYATLDEFDNGLVWPKKTFPDLVIPQWEYFIKRGQDYRYAPPGWRTLGASASHYETYWLRTVQAHHQANWYACASSSTEGDRLLNRTPIRDFDEAAIVALKEMHRALVLVAA